MPQPVSTRTAAQVDVILSKHVRGYRNADHISHILAPRVSIPNRSMRTIMFGKEGFRKLNTRRAPGGTTKRVQYGYDGQPISLVQDALEGLLPMEIMEEAAKAPDVDLAEVAVNSVMEQLDLGLEVETAQLLLDASKYSDNNKMALSGSDKWSDPSSNPKKDIKAGREAVRRKVGRYPNVLELSAGAFEALEVHPKITEQFKYTSSDSITEEMLAKYFGVPKVVVGRSVYLEENAQDDDDAKDIWGQDALLAYVPTGNEGNFLMPSFAYTYELDGYPQVEQPYYERPIKSWVYPTTVERNPKLVGADAGFLFKDVVDAPA